MSNELTPEQMDLKRKALRETLAHLKKHMRVTKVVCTRSVKGRGGDTYVGFSSAWDSTQDDSGGGGDLLQEGPPSSGMTLKESQFAALALGMQADIAAHNNAMASGNITQEHRDEAVRLIKTNYTQLMLAEMGDKGGQNE